MMEVVHQVKLLLRRNIALRLRQPVILALELLWPVAIFLVVMSARNAIPPVAQPTCHYKAWALPSAGVVPFVQSMICNIDECQNETEYEDIPSYKGSSVRELVANTMPLIMDQDITELVTALPKGMRLMRVAVDALSGPDLSALLDDGFPIRDLLRDANQTRELLHDINMTSDDIELILESSIQLPQILEITSQSHLCDFDHHSDGSPSDIIGKLRRHLCSSDEIVRKDFFRQLKNQLDVRNIVQTMGLAMSELGRLDVGEILGNIGGLLINLQSSNIFHEDTLRIVAMLLDEVQFDRIDTEVIPLVIDDLEPLYRESEWSPLIQVLKDVKLPFTKDARRTDQSESGIFERDEKVTHIPRESQGNNDLYSLKNNKSDIVKASMGIVETVVDIVKFLPQEASFQIQSGLKYFTLLVDIAEDLEKSLKKDNSTKFIDNLSDILGAVFLIIADGAKPTEQETLGIPKYKKFCDVREFKKMFNSSEWNIIQALQRYACQISKISEKLPDSPSSGETTMEKLWKIFNEEKYADIYRNILKWTNETNVNGSGERTLSSKKTSMMNDGDIDDLIAAVECGIQGFQGFSHTLENSQMKNINNSESSPITFSTEISKKILNNQERLLLLGLTRAKDITNYMRSNPLLLGLSNNAGFSDILAELYKIMTAAGGESLHQLPATSSEFIRLIPAMIFVTSDFSTNATLRESLPSLMSAFVQDFERYIWKSINPKMVEEFSIQNASKNFCIDAETLEATQLHWKWMLCKDSTPAFKIPLPNESTWEKGNIDSMSTMKINTGARFGVQDFTRTLLHLTSGLGFTVKTISQFLLPINGCNSTCGKTDVMLKKMCFLGRLQNVKNAIDASSMNKNEEELPDESDGILKQLQPLISVDDEITHGYNTFMDAVRSSSVNNYTDWKDIVQLVVSGLRFLDSFDGKDHKLRPTLHVTNSLISLLKNRVSDAAQSRTSPMVEIQNVFPDSPLTQEVVKSLLPLLPEVTSTFFWTALAPGKILNLVSESGKNISVIMSVFCNSSLTQYLYNPALSPSEFENLGEALCRHEYYDVFEEIFQDPDIQEIAFEASSTDEVVWEDMHDNILEIVSLLRGLSDVRKADVSSFPPLTKWQKMAMDIHAQAMKPSVILYILNNKIFFGFCNGTSQNMPFHLKSFFTADKENALYRTLCSMSSASFAKKLVMKMNHTYQNSAAGAPSKENGYNLAALSQQMWKELGNVPEINSIAKVVLGLDLSDDFTAAESSRNGVNMQNARKMVMNATERAFDIVNSVSGGGLSTAILGSFIPEVLEDFSSFILHSDGVINFDKLFKNGSKSDKVLNLFLQNDPERRRLESYIQTLADYFSKEENSKDLTSLCNALKKSIGASNHVIRDFNTMVCSETPSNWSFRRLNGYQSNMTVLWVQIDQFLTEKIKNATQEIYFHKRKEEFMKSIDKMLMSGIRVSDWSSVQMSSFYFNMMRSFVRNLANIQNSSLQGMSCLTKSSEMAIRFSAHKLLHSIPDAKFLTCDLLNKNISDFYSWFSKSAQVKNAFVKVVNGTKRGEKCRHSWKWLLTLIDDLEDTYQKLSKNIAEEELMVAKKCIINFKKSPLFSSLEMHVKVLQQAAKFLSTLNAPAGHWKGMKEQIFERISQHLPAFLKISEVISEESSQLHLEYAISDRDTFKNLLQTSVNFNWLLRQRFSPIALRKKLCNGHASIPSVVSYPPQISAATRIRLKEFFCLGNGTENLLQQMNHSRIKIEIRKIQEKEFFTGKWLQELSGSSDILIDVGSHLVSSLTDIRIQNLYDVFQLFSKPQVVQSVAESFGKLMNVIEPVFPDSLLVETLQQVMDGLKAFRSLTQLANLSFTYSVKDVFGDDARDVLLNELQMDPQFVDSFLKSEINLKQVLTDKDTGQVSLCGVFQDSSLYGDALCKLSSHPKTAISTERLQDLVFQRFLLSFGTLGVEGLLHEAEVDVAEAGRTLEVLSNAPYVVSKLTNHLESITTVMHPEVRELFQKLDQDSDWIATPEALSTGGRILCGKPLTSLSQKFLLLAPEQTENKIEEKELQRLPTDFCRLGYKEIMSMRGGAILWGFLKPLFRGKILYSPKNYAPAYTIISKVNETFNILEEHVRFIKAAAEGSTGLHYLQRKNETLQSLKKLLSSKAVSKFLGSPSWGSALSWLEAPSSSSRSLLHLVELVGNVTQCISLDRFIGFDTEEELEAAAATLHDRREFIAAIIFVEEDKYLKGKHVEKRWNEKQNGNQLPRNVMYKIRMDIDNVPTTEYIKYRWWRPYPYDDFFEDLRYFRGFIQLQDTVDSAIIDLQSKSSESEVVKKYLQQFPYPCHQRDKFGTLLKGSMPAVMTISWVFIVAFLVRERVLDRELELEETLSVMGLKKSSSWLAWFVTGLSILLVSVVGIVAVLKWGGITPNSDPFLLFLFVADFAVLLIAYCQLMSTFFERASTAALLSVLLYVLSFFPFLLFVTWELDFLYWQKLLSCLLVSTSFCFGCLYLNRYEDQGQGVHWSNVWQSPVANDRMNFGTTLVAMSLCSLGYFFISWYASRVIAGYKGRKPLAWYFVLKPSPTGGEPPQNGLNNHKITPKNAVKSKDRQANGKVANKTVGISINNVHALYSKRGCSKWRALSGLNLDLYEDNITALLGHNGAGKTTTIKILTGRILPTAGNVSLYGLSVPGQLSEAKKLMGFCPQNNTLYDKLTVKEHLNLFARLKGLLDAHSVDKDVSEMLDRLNLTEKQNECSETLSGGQRRRLCVGIAFVGGSKVVILDEPTSSVDPVARRSIWDLILSYKKGRTILFTTHHLDEADILSDRVAILHKGRMLCSGSPLELKGRFGSGYRLSLLPGTEKSEQEERDSGRASSIAEYEERVNVDCDAVMEFIQSHVPDATLLENDDSHLVMSLPAEPLTLKPLSEIFAHLEKCLHLWGFQSCSLSSATLEEVFLTLCRLEDAKAAHNSEKFNDMSPFRLKKANEPALNQNTNDCCKKCDNSLVLEVNVKKTSKRGHSSFAHLKYSQLHSLIKKRFWHTKRNWKALLSSIVMPCLFIALAMALAVGRPQKAPDPSLELTPSLYSSKSHKGVSFFEFEKPKTGLDSTLLETVRANTSQIEFCHQGYGNCRPFSEDPSALEETRCLCERECPASSRTPTSLLLTPDQILYNMSDLNIPRYLLDSYLQFNEKRYGGWTVNKEEEHELATKVWFENSGYHSAPSYLNTLNNAILKNKTRPDFGIRTWSHPLRLSVEQLGRETLLHRLGEVGIAFVFLIGLSLVPCTFAVYIVGERESEQKRLQMVTGALGPFMYWGAALLWDMSIVLVTSMISAVIVSAFGLPAFYHRENFRAVYTLIFLYGWATTPLTYLCCRFFREGSLAFMVIFTSHLFIGLVIMLSLVSLRMISISKDVASTLDLLQKLSLAFPQYSLVGGLTDLNENQIRTEIFAQFGQDVYVSPFSWNSLGPNFIALFVQGFVFFLLTVLLEVLPLPHWCQRKPSQQMVEEKNGDDALKPLLQIQNISQVYHSKAGQRYAVDNLTLNIPHGECFGLVGANGAGKTTLFRLLIGEIQPTSGRIISVGLQSKASPKHQFLGYCPQKDALDGLLTPRQHLEVYAGLRGTPSSKVHTVVEQSLKCLELETHADRPVHTLSGGTKRKLCTAIATLGDPELVLLDEPTSGMDPATRRLVWKCISRATEAGRSVILTSHSIEDCDVLCSRLGIMVNGRLACLDSPVKLKTRLGTGYTLSFRIPEGKDDWAALLNFIRKEIPSAHLQVHSGRRIELALPDENINLSTLFCQLEECAKLFQIEDLAIDPTTLDQVFVNFVRQQSDAVHTSNRHSDSKVFVPRRDGNLEMCSTKL